MRQLLPKTRRGWWALVLAVVVFGGGGTFVWWQDRYLPWYHFRTIVPGALYRAGQPNADDVREAISGNLCRCTGYLNIVKAVLHAAERLQQGA